MIRINPSIEALHFGETLAIFAGDRSLSFRGKDNLEFFDRVRSLFIEPKTEDEIRQRDEDVYNFLPTLFATGVLLKDCGQSNIEFFGTGIINDCLRAHLEASKGTFLKSQSLLICIPDTRSLITQNEALARLKDEQMLLTGYWRGTTLFVLPLVGSRNFKLLGVLSRLLSTEAGIGNSYLLDLLSSTPPKAPVVFEVDKIAGGWAASDLHTLIVQGRLSERDGYIYRGSLVLREDVDFTAGSARIQASDTVEEKVVALSKAFVGAGKVISRHQEYALGNDQTKIFAVSAEVARSNAVVQSEDDEPYAWGTGDTISGARLPAFMEAIERYCIRCYSIEEYPLSSIRSMTEPVLTRSAVNNYGALDIYSADLPEDAERRWHPIRSLADGRSYLAPLELIRYPIPSEPGKCRPSEEATSSGVAAHFSSDLAIQSACHELVERDALLIAWLRRAAPPLIDLNSLPVRVREEVDSFVRSGWSIKMIDLTADLAPVVCVLASNGLNLHRHSIGLASSDNVEITCLKALREAKINTKLKRSAPRSPEEVLDKLSKPKDHLELYATGRYDDLLMGFFGSADERAFDQIRRFSGNLSDRILNAGYDVFVSDLTAYSVKRLMPNICVVRAIVPGLVPIRFGKNWPLTGSPRIWGVPEQAGWRTEAKHKYQLQRFPHPFN